MIIKNCLQCKKEFRTSPSRVKDGKGKLCSKGCYVLFQKSHNYMENLVGQRFGRLLILRFHHSNKTSYYWLFRCDCGTERLTTSKCVKSGEAKSCGCLRNEKTKERKGDKSPTWRGDKVGYGGIHIWVKKFLGSPTKCEHCNKDGLTRFQIHWVNKSHEYKRDLTDWLRLCASCHKIYDLNFIKS